MGDKEAADQAAVDAMRMMLESVRMDGVVVIGEGEKDEAPMLYNGEHIGDGSPPEVDIAVDPLEGTRLTRAGHAERAGGDRPGAARDDVQPRAHRLHGEARRRRRRSPTCSTSTGPLGETVGLVAERKGIDVRDVMVVVLDRPRHEEGINAIREAGARVRLITDGDVSAALMAVSDNTPVDLLWGIGGTPEGVLAASRRSRPSAASSWAGCGPATTPSARRRSTPATTSSAS